MRILIRLPNWLGDGVMFSPAFEILKAQFRDADFVLVGPSHVIALFANDGRVCAMIEDESKKARCRFLATWKLGRFLAREFKEIHLAITLTNHFYSALLLFGSRALRRVGYRGFLRSFLLTDCVKKQAFSHQVLSYVNLLSVLGFAYEIGELRLAFEKKPRSHAFKGSIGIAPGAAFGSSKMWLIEYFALVASHFLKKGYEVILFGGKSEQRGNQMIADHIWREFKEIPQGLRDLSNQTDIKQLCEEIGGLSAFLGNDSGPMHIAAAMKTPLVAIFGPTHPTLGLPWKRSEEEAIVLNLHLSCSPCLKRICPLGHHQCMRGIKPDEVVRALERLLI